MILLTDLNRFTNNKTAISNYNNTNNTISFNNSPNINFNLNKLNSNKNLYANKSLDRGVQQQTNLNFSEICNFKTEINKLVEENIFLKSQLINIKEKINQYDNILERTDLKYQEQINNYQKQIIKYNCYIHEVYIFFNNITKNYIPELNFCLKKNEAILISLELFRNKLSQIEKYICELNKSTNNFKNNDLLYNRNITEISTDNIVLRNKGYFLTEFNNKNTLEERINNLERQIINKRHKILKKNIPIGKNRNINNSLVSKYHYGNININDQSKKQYKKINGLNNNDRYRSAFGKRERLSNKKSLSELNSKNKYSKNTDLRFLKKIIPFKEKRTLTPLPKKKIFK